MRGVHFSLSEREVVAFRALDLKARVVRLSDEIETDYFENQRERLAESNKAWDAMHRALAGGSLASSDEHYPLTHLVLGGENLGDDDRLMIVKTPQQVRDVAAALPKITRTSIRPLYDAIGGSSYEGPLGDEDFGYTWEYFEGVRDFWLRAAEEGRYVLFSVNL